MNKLSLLKISGRHGISEGWGDKVSDHVIPGPVLNTLTVMGVGE
ncbi:hypothetical protein [Nitrosomonas sp.]|nr:hypothetical protein [Nitrosomonas sp.]